MPSPLILTIFLCCLLSGVAHGQATCQDKADILFIVDASSSIGTINFQKQLDFLSAFTDRFQIGPVQFSVIVFSNSATILFPFNTYPDHNSLKHAIARINYVQGSTNAALALEIARTTGFTSSNGARLLGVPKVAVVLTDGASNDNYETTRQAQLLKDSGVLILSVGIGMGVNEQELKAIATFPEDVFRADTFDVLVSVVHQYSQMTCDELKLFRCNTQADIFFLVDSSNLVLSSSFDYADALHFASSLASSFDLNSVSFGAATFGNSVYSLFKLRDLADHQQIEQVLLTAPYIGGTADTAQALQWISSNDVFSAANGGRNNATKILVIFTDGRSSTATQAAAQSDLLAMTGVNIIAVGLNSGVSYTELNQLASTPQNVFTSTGSAIFTRIEDITANRTCGVPLHAVRDVSDACRIYNWVNGIHAHPYDCTKFIECTFLQTDIMDCPPDLIYDPNKEVCDYPGAIDYCDFFNTPNRTLVTPIYNPVPTAIPCIKGQIDVLFIIDGSAKITTADYNTKLQFASNLAENFQIGPNDAQFSTTIYSATSHNIFDFDTYYDFKQLQHAILNAARSPSSTQTHLALQDAREHVFTSAYGARPTAVKIAVIMTNGGASDPAATIAQAQQLKNAGVHVIAVGSPTAVTSDLQAIASSTSDVFDTNNFSGVLQAIQRYSNSNCTSSFVCVGLQMGDIIFVLDSSQSIDFASYQEQLHFVANVTDNFQLGADDARFGAVVFSTDAQKLFDLNDYSNKAALQNAILSAPFLGSGTDTAKALNYVSSQNMFGLAAGGRVNATKLLIVMTDGRSNSETETLAAAQGLKNIGVKIISIGISSDTNPTELAQLASGGSNYFQVPSFSALKDIMDSVTRTLCSDAKPVLPSYDPLQLCALFNWADGIHPDPNDCSHYVVCSNFVTTVMPCSIGLSFDPVIQNCVNPVFVTVPCSDPHYFGPEALQALTTVGPQPVINVKDICSVYGLADGMYPDPGSCHYFVDCTGFRTDHMACPDGLLFNTVIDVCDDVHVVDCSVNYNYFNGLSPVNVVVG